MAGDLVPGGDAEMQDKHITRIIEELRREGWTDEKILAFIQKIAQ